MSRYAFNASYVDAQAMLGIALAFGWAQLLGISARELSAQAALTVTGHLRARPDPAMECALRAAFASLDEELAATLGDRTPRNIV